MSLVVDGLGVPCPTCSAEASDHCRALTSGRTTDLHVARIEAYWNSYRSAVQWVGP